MSLYICSLLLYARRRKAIKRNNSFCTGWNTVTSEFVSNSDIVLCEKGEYQGPKS